MRITTLQTPRGVKDLLPDEVREKATLERRLAEVFESWGYAPVATPVFEYADVVALGSGAPDQRLFRLFDREGNTLALRPEMTTGIARLAATRLGSQPRPLRLHYIANVFRYDEPQQGRQREFWQAGVELIGASGPEADAEMISLAVAALRAVGLREFNIDIGHHGFFGGLLQGLAVQPARRQQLHDALLARNYVELESLAAQLKPAEREGLLALPGLLGGAEVIDRAAPLAGNTLATDALDELSAVYRAVEAQGCAEHVRIDLSMVKTLDYYTGTVIEGYAPGIGFTLCTGGRYDQLLERFGQADPAVGFALGVERLLLALKEQDAGQGGAGDA